MSILVKLTTPTNLSPVNAMSLVHGLNCFSATSITMHLRSQFSWRCCSCIAENTRAAYPIEYIPNAKIPCVGPHPKNVILLACDAFGVLPPVSKLNLAQTMYHFISGYTALVAGTEDGIKEPQATFSACFGAAFIMLHPTKYAAMLAEKMQKYGATGWLVNTGWSGGRYVRRRHALLPSCSCKACVRSL